MRNSAFYVAVFVFLVKILQCRGSFENFEETAWTEKLTSDQYYIQSSDLTPTATNQNQQYYTNALDTAKLITKPSKNIDGIQHYKVQKQISRSGSPGQSDLIDVFFNKIHNFFPPPAVKSTKKYQQRRPVHNSEVETSKGIDIFIGGAAHENEKNKLIPDFGKNQDMQLILIGTKWCGAGDVAKNKRDVGYFYMTDSCCREHDLCPQAITAKQTKYGLKNTGKFTRSHCECDTKFYNCLKSVNSIISNQLGLVYFNVLGPQCFIEDHPHVCEHKNKGRCVRYGRDAKKDKKYQWLDNKWY